MSEAVIKLQFYDPCVISTEEYEIIQREVTARIIAGDAGPGERVLARLLLDQHSRYWEARRQNEHAACKTTPCQECA